MSTNGGRSRDGRRHRAMHSKVCPTHSRKQLQALLRRRDGVEHRQAIDARFDIRGGAVLVGKHLCGHRHLRLRRQDERDHAGAIAANGETKQRACCEHRAAACTELRRRLWQQVSCSPSRLLKLPDELLDLPDLNLPTETSRRPHAQAPQQGRTAAEELELIWCSSAPRARASHLNFRPCQP